MKDQATITIRLDRSILRAIRLRAVMNDRSANSEIMRVLRETFLPNEKAAGPQLEN